MRPIFALAVLRGFSIGLSKETHRRIAVLETKISDIKMTKTCFSWDSCAKVLFNGNFHGQNRHVTVTSFAPRKPAFLDAQEDR